MSESAVHELTNIAEELADDFEFDEEILPRQYRIMVYAERALTEMRTLMNIRMTLRAAQRTDDKARIGEAAQFEKTVLTALREINRQYPEAIALAKQMAGYQARDGT